MPEDAQPVIVVGVDGSTVSRKALRWAARQAEFTGATLRTAIAWRLPTTFGYAPEYSDVDFAASARETLDTEIAAVLGPEAQLSVRPASRKDTLPQSSSPPPPRERTFSSWAVTDTGRSPRCCSAPPPSTACTTRRAPFSSYVQQQAKGWNE